MKKEIKNLELKELFDRKTLKKLQRYNNRAKNLVNKINKGYKVTYETTMLHTRG